MTLFVCHFESPCEDSVDIVFVPVLLSICLLLYSLTFYFQWETWVWQVKPFAFCD